MDQIQFLQATENDAERFVALQERSTDLKLYGPVGGLKEALREISDNVLYLVRIRDEIVGSVACRVRSDGSVYISNVVVAPDHRRRGIARAAMLFVLEQHKNARRVDLVTHPENEPALRLYRSLGLAVEARRENHFGDGEPRLVLARSG
jgi:ribosomal protein S18 acetylase RimI-like enzyme